MANRDEIERPVEWLRQLNEEPGLFHHLVDQAGTSVAAYRLAVAQNRVRTQFAPLPTLREVRAAASELSRVCDIRVPHDAMLIDDCSVAGLAVITPSVLDHKARMAATSSFA